MFAVSTGFVSRHFLTPYGHIEGLSQLATGGQSADGIRRRCGAPRRSPKVPGHTSVHPTIANQGLRVCSGWLFPARPHVPAISGSGNGRSAVQPEGSSGLGRVPEALSRYRRIDGPEERSGPPAVEPPGPGDVDRRPVVQLVRSIAVAGPPRVRVSTLFPQKSSPDRCTVQVSALAWSLTGHGRMNIDTESALANKAAYIRKHIRRCGIQSFGQTQKTKVRERDRELSETSSRS